jgi:hypothetical protein
MEVIRRHILKRIDGARVDAWYQPVRDIRKAFRLTPDEFEGLMTGHHRPPDRTQYYLQEIEVTYREVTDNVQQIGNDQQDSGGTG